MDFELTLTPNNAFKFVFENDECECVDLYDEEPLVIYGEIKIGDQTIGELIGYELYNDETFYDKCDDVSGDCQVIAEAICGKNGKVLSKYLTKEAEFEKIFILDHIDIEENYRGKGIGSMILKNLPKMLRFQFDYGSNIFLCASAFEEAGAHGFDSSEYKAESQKLIDFYKKFGFKVVKDNVMVYNAPEEN